METEQIVYYNLEVSQKLRIHKAVSKKSKDPDAFSEIDHEFENKELRLKIDIFRGCNSANLFFLKLTVPLIFQPVEANKVRHDHEIGCAQEMLVHNPPDIDFMIGLNFIVEYQNYVLP